MKGKFFLSSKNLNIKRSSWRLFMSWLFTNQLIRNGKTSFRMRSDMWNFSCMKDFYFLFHISFVIGKFLSSENIFGSWNIYMKIWENLLIRETKHFTRLRVEWKLRHARKTLKAFWVFCKFRSIALVLTFFSSNFIQGWHRAAIKLKISICSKGKPRENGKFHRGKFIENNKNSHRLRDERIFKWKNFVTDLQLRKWKSFLLLDAILFCCATRRTNVFFWALLSSWIWAISKCNFPGHEIVEANCVRGKST